VKKKDPKMGKKTTEEREKKRKWKGKGKGAPFFSS
jgi:hypothetical protein